MKKNNLWVIAVISLSAVLVCTACTKKDASAGKHEYVYSTISRGSIEKTVSSSGSLEPVATVKVIAQMSGIAEKVNADYNDHIKKGQVLVELNTDMLKLQKQEKLAAVNKAKANYELQKINYQNQLKLAEKELISDFDLKSSKTTLDSDAADLASAEADLNVIETEINQYAFIKSPINGIVLERDVDVGQNVQEGSSTNSSSLFTLAEDLTQMQIETSVDELDIASIQKGQNARFTVEALPGRTFSGKVQAVYLLPKTTDNVVDYYVIVQIDNSDGTLYPGMTANVEFIVKKSDNILTVPNAALRYSPSWLTSAEIAEKVFYASLEDMSEADRADAIAKHGEAKKPGTSATATKPSGLGGLLMGGGPRGFGGPRPGGSRNQNAKSATATGAQTPTVTLKNLWYVNDKGEVDVIQVKTGVSDGTNTEILSDKNLEGMKIILKEKV